MPKFVPLIEEDTQAITGGPFLVEMVSMPECEDPNCDAPKTMARMYLSSDDLDWLALVAITAEQACQMAGYPHGDYTSGLDTFLLSVAEVISGKTLEERMAEDA